MGRGGGYGGGGAISVPDIVGTPQRSSLDIHEDVALSSDLDPYPVRDLHKMLETANPNNFSRWGVGG